MKTCVVIPYFDHFEQFRVCLPQLACCGLPLLVVDDASPQDDGAALAELLERQAPGSELVRRETNGGKGAAVITGLRAAYSRGFTHAVQVDADGQHDIADLPALLQVGERHQDGLVCGCPDFGEDVSRLRFYARYITLSFCWLETLGTEIRDALCGFRLYPLGQTVALLDGCKPGERMAFDPEILVRAVWAGLPLHFVPVRVRYPQGGKSHFRYVADNVEITWMHARLIAGMLLRIPQHLKRRRLRAAEGGSVTRHWAATREAGALAGMRFMVWVNARIGRSAFTVLLVFVMAYFYLRRGVERRASKDFLSRVRSLYPDALGRAPLAWLSYRQFLAFGDSLLDKYLVWAESPDHINMDPHEEEVLFDAAASGQGCLLIGSHFGNLEYSRGVAHRHPDLVINVLLYDRHARKFAALIEQGDPESRMNLYQVTEIDFELALTLRERIRRGEWVVIAGDRVPIADNGRVCEALFLGDEARFPVGPYVLASVLQCPVYLLHCFKLQGEYHLGIELFSERIQADRRTRDAVYAECAQRFASALEKQVSREPLQWFNFFDFWDAGAASGRRSEARMTT